MFTYSPKTAAIVKAAIVAIVAIGGVAAPVFAQDSAPNGTAEQLLACDGMIDPTERLACFNDIVEGVKQVAVAPAASSPPAPASAPSSPAATVNTSSPTDTPVAPTVTSEAVVDDLGRESVEAKTVQQKNPEKKTDVDWIQATIVRSWHNRDDRFVVELDNGQVWQQTDGYRIGLPKEGGSVEISKRRFGGYRIKIEKKSRLIAVRQTK